MTRIIAGRTNDPLENLKILRALKKRTGFKYTKGLINKDIGRFYIATNGEIRCCNWYTAADGEDFLTGLKNTERTVHTKTNFEIDVYFKKKIEKNKQNAKDYYVIEYTEEDLPKSIETFKGYIDIYEDTIVDVKTGDAYEDVFETLEEAQKQFEEERIEYYETYVKPYFETERT